MISADGFTVILISLEDFSLCFFSGHNLSSKWSVDPFQTTRIRGIYAPAAETCSSFQLRARRDVPGEARSRADVRKQNRIVHPWSRRVAPDEAQDQPSEYSSLPKERSGRKYLFHRSRSSIDAPDSHAASGVTAHYAAPSPVLWKAFQLFRCLFALFLRHGRNLRAIRRLHLQKNIVRPTGRRRVQRQRSVSFRRRAW